MRSARLTKQFGCWPPLYEPVRSSGTRNCLFTFSPVSRGGSPGPRAGVSRLPPRHHTGLQRRTNSGSGRFATLDKIGTTRSAKSNARGEVRFDALQPGTYAISADATGFKGTTAAVVVAVGSQPTLGITLAPQTIQETVQVRDRGPSLASQPIETTNSAVKTVITSADLDEVPLSARTFANISLLAPFTAPVEPSDPTKARITAVSFCGSSGLNVD